MCKENDQGKSGYAAGNGKRISKETLFANLTSSTEFTNDLERVADLLGKEKGSGLEVGKIAYKWIGDRRYNRVLNAEVFATELKARTGRDVGARQVRSYMDAHKMEMTLNKAGVKCPRLGVSHLAQIVAARCESEAEQVELAKRAHDEKSTVRGIRPLAQRLHAERLRARRLVDVVATKGSVQVMDAIDLLRGLEDGSSECVIGDWQWMPAGWGRHQKYPEVYVPNDPAAHLCECLEVIKNKLAPCGTFFLFHSAFGFMDKRIQETCERVGLKHVGKLIWQKSVGTFQNVNAKVRIGHEEIIMLCHTDHRPVAMNGGTNSVTPKWTAPTCAVAGRTLNAIHIHEKPVPLMELLIRISTVNGLVVDPFAGSGSSGIAAVRRGCPYLGSELMPDIAEKANRRIALAHKESEQVVEAINFFMEAAAPDQRQTIESALKRSNLNCVQNMNVTLAA